MSSAIYASMHRRPYSATYNSLKKQDIPGLFAVYNTRAQLLQKWHGSLACIVWFQNGRAVNLINWPVVCSLVKMTRVQLQDMNIAKIY